MSILETLQEQRGLEQLTQEIGNFMFDMLNTPMPAELQERFQYPKCPFCKGRPRLVEVRGATIQVPLRAGSPVTLAVSKYRIEMCCNATYKTKHKGLSTLQKIRLTAQVEAAQKKTKR
jgi:hypothetical protein